MLFWLLLSVFLTCTTASSSSTNLKSVIVVFRHGDSDHKTPAFYPLDPAAPHDYDPHVDSILNPTGMVRSYRLGEYLHKRYSDFLGEEYKREDVYARSTYTERARASLMTLLAALFPPKNDQTWHPNLNWQPISIESPEAGADDPLMWPIDCPTYREERQMLENQTEFMQQNIRFFVEYFIRTGPASDFSEAKLKSIYTKLLFDVHDYDKPILDWTKVPAEVTLRFAHDVAFLRYRAQNGNNKLIRLNGGMLLRKIIDDMERVKAGEENLPKIYLYGGQEFNVVGLLDAMNAFHPIIPTYTSAAILELLEKEGDYYVKVFYHDGLSRKTNARTIVGCTLDNSAEMCLFEDFRDMLQANKTLPDGKSECYSCDHFDTDHYCRIKTQCKFEKIKNE